VRTTNGLIHKYDRQWCTAFNKPMSSS
jgi:hypothetical protein